MTLPIPDSTPAKQYARLEKIANSAVVDNGEALRAFMEYKGFEPNGTCRAYIVEWLKFQAIHFTLKSDAEL